MTEGPLHPSVRHGENDPRAPNTLTSHDVRRKAARDDQPDAVIETGEASWTDPLRDQG